MLAPRLSNLHELDGTGGRIPSPPAGIGWVGRSVGRSVSQSVGPASRTVLTALPLRERGYRLLEVKCAGTQDEIERKRDKWEGVAEQVEVMRMRGCTRGVVVWRKAGPRSAGRG